jgi:hypothetical protein
LLIRRTGVWGLAYTAYKLWRYLPPKQRRQLMRQAQKHGPRVAKAAAKRARRKRPKV